MSSNSLNTFPDQYIDPRNKGKDYIYQYVSAAWDASGKLYPSFFYFGNAKMEEIRQYAMGKQAINKYKKILSGTEADEKMWMNIDWSVIPILPKFREIGISKMMQKVYNPIAKAVDPLSRSEEDDYWNKLRAKIEMQSMAQQAGNQYVANNPMFKPAPNEPQDLEQLEMEFEFGFKHNLCMQIEEGLQLILSNNKKDYHRKKIFENLYDFGIAGYKEWIDEDGNVCYRSIDPMRLVISYCEEPDFSDLEYAGDIIMVSVRDLAAYFDEDEMNEIIVAAAGKYNNPLLSSIGTNFSLYYDRFHVPVLDFQFYDYDVTVYKSNVDSRGNERFGKTDFKDLGKIRNVNKEDTSSPKYANQVTQVVRKTKWIVGTRFMYDYGIAENMPRKQSNPYKTKLGVHLIAWNYNKMQYTGITERLIPIADAYMLTWYKLQNLTIQLIPYIINVDFDALENVPFGAGGEKMKPMEIMDLIFQRFIAVGRSSDMGNKGVNGKIVTIEATGMLEAFGQLYNDLNQKYALMQQVAGFNAATDGSTINPKTLNGATDAMQAATNSALYMISDAEETLFLNLCDALVCKLQIAVKLGKVEGYIKALGSDTIKFLSLTDAISPREFGIFLEDQPSMEDKQMLLADLQKYDAAGLLEPQDKILILSYNNLKHAYMILAYKVKKRKEEMQQNALQNQQMTIQGQQQSAMLSEKAKQETIQLQGQIDIEKINAQGQWQFANTKMKVDGKTNDTQIMAEAKKIATQITAESKKDQQQS